MLTWYQNHKAHTYGIWETNAWTILMEKITKLTILKEKRKEEKK